MSSGGEHETLAPVIPLFGGPVPTRPAPSRSQRPASVPDVLASPDEFTAADVFEPADEFPSPDAMEWTQEPAATDDETPPSGVPRGAGASDGRWHQTWATDRRAPGAEDRQPSPDVELAEKTLLKKLRTRSLSISEARGVLRDFDLDAVDVDQVLASMEEYGYLDDAALAEQLVHAGVERKGQGRQVIAQTLAKRGIPRDVADTALAAMPDDDLERALEFARGKARSLRSVDRDTALRRLTGQLARRGYGGSVAMTAARTALDEGAPGTGGVRFR